MRPPRIALYGHDTLGLGHLRRNLALAASLSGLDPKPDILIDAVAVLRDRGLRVPLRLAGGGRLEVALRDQVTGCDLGDLITFLGPLPQHVIHDLVAGATMCSPRASSIGSRSTRRRSPRTVSRRALGS